MPTARSLAVENPQAHRIGVVSDTHSRPHPAFYDLLASERPKAILHAGDIGTLDILDRLEEIAPVIAVRGNMDARSPGLPDAMRVSLEHEGDPLLVIYLTHVAVYGARLQPLARQAATAAGADLVVCGHSHVPLIAKTGKLAIFNPGSCGPRRFRLPITFGMLELTENGARLRHVDCETGGAWRPPA